MKKIYLLLLFAAPVFAKAQTGNAVITGTLKNITAPTPFIFYAYNKGDEMVLDSATIADNKYHINIETSSPQLITLFATKPTREARPEKKDMASVFIQEGNLAFNSVDSFSNISVTGSPAQDEFVKLGKQLDPVNTQMKELMNRYQKASEEGDTGSLKGIEDEYEAIQEAQQNVYGEYVKNNPTSPIALWSLNNFAGYDIDPAKVEPLFTALPETIRNSNGGKNLAKRIDVAKKTAVGSLAPEFMLPDTTGKSVALSSFKGKYVLVDFWASWCGPCRAENPNVVKAYNNYKNKNFTVLGVSLDDEDGKDAWLQAIQSDQLNWTQLSDLKGWENEAAVLYGIRAIPQNFLLDPSGKIIAKNIRGEELDKKLNEVLN